MQTTSGSPDGGAEAGTKAGLPVLRVDTAGAVQLRLAEGSGPRSTAAAVGLALQRASPRGPVGRRAAAGSLYAAEFADRFRPTPLPCGQPFRPPE